MLKIQLCKVTERTVADPVTELIVGVGVTSKQMRVENLWAHTFSIGLIMYVLYTHIA